MCPVLQSELVRTHYGRNLFEVGDELERETEVARVAATSGCGTESRWDTGLGNDFGPRNPHAASARFIANGHLSEWDAAFFGETPNQSVQRNLGRGDFAEEANFAR